MTKAKPKTCVFDNPLSGCREAWMDGNIISSSNFSAIHNGNAKAIPFYLNIGPVRAGKVIGDPKAMEKVESKEDK